MAEAYSGLLTNCPDVRAEIGLSDDGHRWKKYGQKHAKGSDNSRSYYICKHPNCPARKKLERSSEGEIIEITYRGEHTHPRPAHTDMEGARAFPNEDVDNVDALNQAIQHEGAGQFELYSNHPRDVRQSRVVIQTDSEDDIVDDGYTWRKYGQKVVKGNLFPRSYYRCAHGDCGVKKQVERSSSDPKNVRTTYEGMHSHDLPTSAGHDDQPQQELVQAPWPYHHLVINQHDENVNGLCSSATDDLMEQSGTWFGRG